MDAAQTNSSVPQVVVPQKPNNKITNIVLIALGLVALFLIAEIAYYLYNKGTYPFSRSGVSDAIVEETRNVGPTGPSTFNTAKWGTILNDIDLELNTKRIFHAFQVQYSFQGRVTQSTKTDISFDNANYAYLISITTDVSGENLNVYFTESEMDIIEISGISESIDGQVNQVEDIVAGDNIKITLNANMLDNSPIKYSIIVSR